MVPDINLDEKNVMIVSITIISKILISNKFKTKVLSVSMVLEKRTSMTDISNLACSSLLKRSASSGCNR